ncbi:chitooligosaccharidolytic beta-N-acetylglucosaminidase [Teleopsis dalmanni]|uniref:chitooligosaccharidolytic beta-N-acetylglucosaminidase n=1 Tax=Teleopsis dalmanni TaxID=139649 RepID=UPI0018CDF071|nr:chitooligosaccharidolytic beta-N-acetylglucosaminidase [Teleopsis dalmanni]XP_037941466.1 chitooligosaccharidolytic beta-N-acetylglucosaminidase [Teleopsis dalmanni]
MRTAQIFLFTFVLLVALEARLSTATSEDLIYGYECQNSKCVKVELNQENFNKAISLPVCRIFCGETIGTVLPKPTGSVKIDSYMLQIDHSRINFNFPSNAKQSQLWQANRERFMSMLDSKIPNAEVVKNEGHPLQILIEVNEKLKDEVPKLDLDTDESYKLIIAYENNNEQVTAKIVANSFFGARHGMETLAQLIIYDDIRRELQLVASAEINDAPVYKWRGLLLDTSRNFYSIKSIKRTLDGMAMVKLNTFHWHITDSHSFPLEIKSQPDLYKLGAYTPRKVYTHEEVADVVEYGRIRGIRVMPEFDAPAHVGEGWQHKNMTACFNAQPWKDYCVEPPCGQLDPTVDELYPVLEDIYREMYELFKPDIFHMGGDEVSTKCWLSSERITKWMTEKGWTLEDADFLRLWGYFQTKALERVDNVFKDQKVPIILWTSHLTDVPYIDDYLDKDRYIIQIWTTGFDTKVQDILKRGFRVIVSNYDALYFDCGGAGWVSDGNNWCSPYIGWQKVYQNSLEKIAGDYSSLVLGAEATIWSEQIDEHTLDSRLWPRASALAERLWTNPEQNWRQAEPRMLLHRERLVENGIAAEALQPEWCLQNENNCPVDAFDAKF